MISLFYHVLILVNYYCIYYGLLVLILSLIWTFLIYQFIKTMAVKERFFFFFLILMFFIAWGIWVDLDGIMLLILLTELMLLVVFYLTYTQHYLKLKNYKINTFIHWNIVLLLWILLCGFSYNDSLFVNFENYYSAVPSIISTDFFIFFYFFFSQYPLILIFLIIILGIFSIVFIFFYYNLKILQTKSVKTSKNLYFLRKQTLLKQSNFRVSIRKFS